MIALLSLMLQGEYYVGKERISLQDIVDSGGRIYVRVRRIEKDLSLLCRLSVDGKKLGVHRDGIGGKGLAVGNGQDALVHSQDLFLSLQALETFAKIRREEARVVIDPKAPVALEPKRVGLEPGDPMVDFSFPLLQDRKQTVQLSKHRGKRILLVLWASWDRSREDSRKWQEFYAEHKGRDVVVISVAVDAAGEERARRYVDRTVTHSVALDAHWRTVSAFGSFPLWVLVDEVGFIRSMGTETPDVNKLGKTETSKISAWVTEGSPAADSWQVALRSAADHWQEGRTKEGVDVLKEYLKSDESRTFLRRQKWAVEFPEKIYADVFDEVWMREQEDRERRGG